MSDINIRPSGLPDINYTNQKGDKCPIDSILNSDDLFLYKRGSANFFIIKLQGIHKLCDHLNVVEKNFKTEIVPTEGNKQQHAVNIWVGFKGDKDPDDWRRGSGEANRLNTGELVVKTDAQGVKMKVLNEGTIDAKFRYAMADKRAFSRAVLKLLKIHGAYSEIESPDFMNSSISDSDKATKAFGHSGFNY